MKQGSQWLLTPIAHTQTEAHFNTAHARLWSVVERSIGMLKGRWRWLDVSGGRLLYDPEKGCQIILACCVLHNICLSHGIELGEEEMRMDQDDHPPIPAGWNTHITVLRRRELIHQLYQQVNNVDKNKCTHVHIFFRMFYLGTFVQRTLNSGQSLATTSLTDSFKSLCE